MKKAAFVILFSIFNLTLFAQNYISSKGVVALRNAKNAYEAKEYGKALKYAEDAIYYRKTQSTDDYELIQNSLSSRQVKMAGDDIEEIIKVLNERDEYDCINTIKFYTNKKECDNSISKVLEYIKSQEDYPEAEKLIGDIYKLEGEYDFAEEYYLKALANSAVLDIPDERYEIIYLLADISRLRNDYEKMEIRLLNIIGKEQNNLNMILARSMKNTIARNNEDAIEKFFQMYRADDYYSLKAYCKLADYYLSIGQLEKAFDYSALSVITGFTKTFNVITKRELDFEYSNISDFLDLITNHQDIVSWGNENDVWKSFNLFCEVCNYSGYDVFAMNLLKILAFHAPQKYWQQDAVLKLDKRDGIKNPD